MKRKRLLTCALLSFMLLAAEGQKLSLMPPPPDDRYKADILLVLAHPDDDTDISTYLWKAVLDEKKRVAVVYTTRGNSGGNAMGMEQSKALSTVREIEARRSLAARAITNVWFLHGSDTPTQDVLHSLETLGHGEAIEDVVRIIRLTRPAVILTWLPAYVDGENHGDHQAASVVANEAFDLAGSRTAFAEQIAAPRDRSLINNYGEGLHAWQVKKIYYFSDATNPEFLAHHGPVYLASDICRSKGVPFSQLNRTSWDFYRTQIDFSEKTMVHNVTKPDYLVLGKSLVAAPLEGDVLAGADSESIAYAPPQGAPEPPEPPVSLDLGGPWAFYHEFYRAHGLTFLETLVKPQSGFVAGNPLWVPLLLSNHSQKPVDVLLHASLPEGWTPANDMSFRLEPGTTLPVQLFLKAPPGARDKAPQLLNWRLMTDGRPAAEVQLAAYLEGNGVPQ